MFDVILGAVVEAAATQPSPPPVAAVSLSEEWRDQRPSRGGAGRFLDSNHPAVWRGVPTWIRSLGLCIRKHESIMAGHYAAHSGRSSAAGAYQFLDGTWRGNAKWTKVAGRYVARGYPAANLAPAWVQDAVFVHSIRHGGIKNWHGTLCPGT